MDDFTTLPDDHKCSQYNLMRIYGDMIYRSKNKVPGDITPQEKYPAIAAGFYKFLTEENKVLAKLQYG